MKDSAGAWPRHYPSSGWTPVLLLLQDFAQGSSEPAKGQTRLTVGPVQHGGQGRTATTFSLSTKSATRDRRYVCLISRLATRISVTRGALFLYCNLLVESLTVPLVLP